MVEWTCICSSDAKGIHALSIQMSDAVMVLTHPLLKAPLLNFLFYDGRYCHSCRCYPIIFYDVFQKFFFKGL